MKVKVRKAGEKEQGKRGASTKAAASTHTGRHDCVGAAVGAGGRAPAEERVVMVGMKMDALCSRELLTWVLVQVARPGDRVFAIHVLPRPSSFSSSSGPNPSSPLSLLKLVKDFDSVLAVYEGFCKLKQIDLKLKLCRDSSVRKALVREAAGLGASQLILGVNDSGLGFRSSSTSVAKYCAKKLPTSCSVLAFDNGKVVFERTDSLSGERTDRVGRSDEPGPRIEGPTNPVNCRRPNCNVSHSKSPLSNDSATQRSSSWGSPSSSSDAADSQTTGSPHSNEVNPLALVPITTPRSLSGLIRDLPEAKPGWPLLRRAVLQNKKAAVAAAAGSSKISVVQWVMQLPDRYPESPVHPDHRPVGTGTGDEDEATSQAGKGVHPERCFNATVTKDDVSKVRKELESLRSKYAPVCRLFSYQELAAATSNFSRENLIGRGGSSHVYRGRLPDGREMAVKIMKQTDEARKELALEIEMITALHHENIITLFGFCVEDDDSLMLVYDFLSRGSLEDNLHGPKHKKSEFGWTARYKVAVGVAEALQHLHGGGSSRPVIHRDVKSSNILLSDDFAPRLSDFGLATWVSSASSHVTCTDVAGTFGYLAPEYFMFGKVNEKIDVYAFGVVLLELLSGKKPIGGDYPKGQESLVMWAKPFLQCEHLAQLMDPSLGGQYDEDQAGLMVLAASFCLRRSPQLRPKMDLVVKLLRGDCNLVKWARLQMKGMTEPGQELEDEADTKCLASDFQSHLNLALLDVEDDTLSVSSTEHSLGDIIAHGSLEAYLQGRWSRSSSFD